MFLFKRQGLATRVVANSIPKAGTHLLRKCILLFPGAQEAAIHLDMSVPNERMWNLLRNAPQRGVVTAHLYYQEVYAQMFAELHYKSLLIIRDPRDLVVSFAIFVTKTTGHYLYKYFNSLPDDHARIMAAIVGVNQPLVVQGVNKLVPELYSEQVEIEGVALGDINSSYHIFLEWSREPYNLIVQFEDIVGPAGGGSHEAAQKVVRKIADHLKVRLSRDEVNRIAIGSYDTASPTFRRGITGDWKNHFSPGHKSMFKDIAGQLLIDLGYEKDLNW
jgi:sulfotransferase 6B1